ncbi:MAG: hypothetical protein QM737_22610 [Ferruginibacter sp.]
MIAAKDLAPTTGTAGDPTYTFATNGTVNAIGLAVDASFVEIGLLKQSAGLKETMTKDDTKGLLYFNQEFSMTVAGISTENRTFVETVLRQPVVVLMKGMSETVAKYFIAGLNEQLTLTALESGTGVSKDDTAGYKLTFSGYSTKLIPLVDNTIIGTLLGS